MMGFLKFSFFLWAPEILHVVQNHTFSQKTLFMNIVMRNSSYLHWSLDGIFVFVMPLLWCPMNSCITSTSNVLNEELWYALFRLQYCQLGKWLRKIISIFKVVMQGHKSILSLGYLWINVLMNEKMKSSGKVKSNF